MANTYEPGDLVRLKTNPPFTDSTGAAADPTTVSVSVLDPNGVRTTYPYPGSVVKDSTGTYHYDLAVSTPGDWYYRWVGTGTVTAADEQLFYVKLGRLA